MPHSPPAVAPVGPASLGLAAEASPAIADDWWTAFGDPQLDRLVADATKGNPNLDAALARVAQGAGDAGGA